jgi:transposase
MPSKRQLLERISELERRIIELEKRNEELEKRLLAYENAHTPPSLRRRKKRKDEEDGGGNEKGTPGRKPGHEGSTRPTPTPDETVEVKMERCPRCDSKLNNPAKVEKRVIEDIPKPQPVRVTEYLLHHYDCENCGAHIRASHPDCPKEGRVGNNAMAYITLLKYPGRMPHRRVCEFMDTMFGLRMTPATSLDITRRVSKALKEDFNAIAERVRNSRVVHTDETGMRVNGNNHWLWDFTTYENDVLNLVRRSRGSDVLVQALGADYGGILVSDGLSAYRMFTRNRQRCWAHLLREVKFLAERHPEAVPLSEALHRLFSKLKERVHEALPPPARMRLWQQGYGILHYWSVRRSYAAEAVQKFANKMKNGLKHFLTFVLHPEVEPTNNRAERTLRESVVVRKIVGTLRNEKGTGIYETLTSVLSTWQQRGLNRHEMLVRRLAGS